MRSNALKAALAATIVSLSIPAAFADVVPPVTIDEPHLGVVMDELNNALDGIKVGRIAHAKQLDQQLASIRADVRRTAAKDGGKLTDAQYHQFLQRIDNLNEANRIGVPLAG